jgi:hypothetical protein
MTSEKIEERLTARYSTPAVAARIRPMPVLMFWHIHPSDKT